MHLPSLVASLSLAAFQAPASGLLEVSKMMAAVICNVLKAQQKRSEAGSTGGQ